MPGTLGGLDPAEELKEGWTQGGEIDRSHDPEDIQVDLEISRCHKSINAVSRGNGIRGRNGMDEVVVVIP